MNYPREVYEAFAELTNYTMPVFNPDGTNNNHKVLEILNGLYMKEHPRITFTPRTTWICRDLNQKP